MRNLAHFLLIASLLALTSTVSAQKPDPFGGGGDGGNPFGSGGADPFGADPFGGPSPRRATNSAAKPKPVVAKPTGRVQKVAARTPSQSTERIRAALSDMTSQSFVDLPLGDAVQQLSASHDIPIVIDRRALDEIGLSVDQPVSLALHRVSLRSFLQLLLRQLDLAYVVKDEVMQITTKEAAEQNLVVEMYSFAPALTEKSDKIIKALTSAVATDAWDTMGGPCTVSAIDNVLVVSATESIHEDVIEFIEKLQQAFEKHQAKR